VKPGKPLAYGHIGDVPLFGLPGNPVSSMVTFDIFVRPAIGHMMGVESAPYRTVSGSLTCDVRHRPGVREFVRATTIWENGRYTATPAGMQGSGRLSSMVNANSYIVIPEDVGDVASGQDLQIIFFE
jgi:molybdopterin molybdotransferase